MRMLRGLVGLICQISFGAWRGVGVLVAQSRQMEAVDKAVEEVRLVGTVRLVISELDLVQDLNVSAEKAFHEMAAAFAGCKQA